MVNKPIFLQVVGCDGAGKTTAANSIQNYTGFPIHHFGPVKSYKEGKEQYFNFIEKTNTSIICDRFNEGEVIFAPIYRGYKADYFNELEEKIKEKFNPLLVLALSPFNVIVKRLNERGEDFVKEEDYLKVYESTNKYFEHSSLPKIVINTNNNLPEDNVKIILNFLKNEFSD